MVGYLNAVWQCRYFWSSLVKSDLRTRYRRSFLGIGWSLLHPLAMTCVLCTVFHRMFHAEIHEFGPFLLCGLTFWNYVTFCSLQGCQCFFQSETYIRQHPAPMAIYPLRVVLGAGFHFVLGMVVVVAMTWLFQGFGNVPALGALLPSMLLLLVFGWAVAVLTGLAGVFFPDTQHLLEIGLQILFYATPIIYPPEMLRDRGMGWLLDMNPITPFLALVRAPIIEGVVPSLSSVAAASAFTALALALAGLTLARWQRKLIFYL